MSDLAKPATTKRERTTERILVSAAELFAESGPAEISIRAVAARAGVSHALVHRYFGSKEDLLAAALDRVAEKMTEAMRPTETAEQLLDNVFDLFLEDQTITRMLTRHLMGSWTVGTTYPFPVMGPTIARLLTEGQGVCEVPAADGFDPSLLAAILGTIALGWAAFETPAMTAAGLDPEQHDHARAEVRRLFAHLLMLADTDATSAADPTATNA